MLCELLNIIVVGKKHNITEKVSMMMFKEKSFTKYCIAGERP